jgi:hypothetical protein
MILKSERRAVFATRRSMKKKRSTTVTKPN